MKFTNLTTTSACLLQVCGLARAQSVEVVPQIALPGAAVLVTDESSQTPRFLPGESLLSPRGALEWRTARGEILKTVPLGAVATTGSVTMVPSPDGVLVAVLSAPEDALRWHNAWSGEIVREFPKQGFPFGFSPNGRIFASTNDEKVTVREVESNREIAVIAPSVALNYYARIQFSSDSTRLAVFSQKQPLEVFEVAGGRKLFDFKDEARIVNARFLPNNGIFVASVAKESFGRGPLVLRRLDAQGRETQSQNAPSVDAYNLKFRFARDAVFIEAEEETRPDKRSYFAWENGKPVARISEARWNALAPKPLPQARLGTPIALQFVRAVGGKTLVGDGHSFWNGVTGKLEWTLSPIVTEATAFDVSRDAKFVAVAGRARADVFAGVWTVADRKLKNKRERKVDGRIESQDFSEGGVVWVTDTQFSPDNRLIAMASGLVSYAPPLVVQDASSGKMVWQWKWGEEHRGFSAIGETRIDFAPNGKSLVILDNVTEYNAQRTSSTDSYGRLRRADSQNGKILAETRTASSSSFALDFAPNGNSLAVSTQSGQWKNFSGYSYLEADSYALELREPQTLELRKSIVAPLALRQIRWSKDSRKIAAIGADTAIYLLDVETEKWTKLAGHAQLPRDVTWLSNDKLASCGDDGRLVFWNVASGKPLATTHLFRFGNSQKVEFLATTPDGWFQSSPGASSFARVRENGKLLSLGALTQTRNNSLKVRAAIQR